MKKIFKNFLFFTVLIWGLLFNLHVFAEGEIIGDEMPSTQGGESIAPEEETTDEEVVLPEPLLVYVEVDVPKTCEVLDTDGVSHTYTASSSESYLGICALDALLEEGGISSVGLSNQYPDMGLFVVSFDNVTADPSSQYWALYQNGNYAMSGLSTLPIVVNDVISFKLSDFSGVETGDSVDIKVRTLVLDTGQEDDGDSEGNGNSNGGSSGGSSSGGSQTENNFSKEEAIAFILSNQLDDNSFGEDLYTDWVTIALTKIDLDDDSFLEIIKNYLENDQIDSSSVTENERRAMALMALGVDPKNGTGEDYIEKITSSFNGEQIGDVDLVNDDIFALIVLSHAGFDKNNEMIKKIIAFIISNQGEDGSWGSVDMTAASIQALRNFKKVDGVSSAIYMAEEYIALEQESDGGFGNVYSTSWAAQALSLNSSFDEEVENAIIYLKDHQEDDGSMSDGDTNDKVWATAYALPAIYELSWNDILDSFSYEEDDSDPLGSSTSLQKEDEEIDLMDLPMTPELIVPEVEIEKDNNVKPIVKVVIPKKVSVDSDQNEIEKEASVLGASASDAPVVKDSSNGFLVSLFGFFSELWRVIVGVFI